MSKEKQLREEQILQKGDKVYCSQSGKTGVVIYDRLETYKGGGIWKRWACLDRPFRGLKVDKHGKIYHEEFIQARLYKIKWSNGIATKHTNEQLMRWEIFKVPDFSNASIEEILAARREHEKTTKGDKENNTKRKTSKRKTKTSKNKKRQGSGTDHKNKQFQIGIYG